VELVDRVVVGLTIRIDRTLCVGFGDCVSEAPEIFDLDDEGIVVFVGDGPIDRDRLVRACDICPVDALTVLDETGGQIVP
jgi:ferredoxin